MQGYISHLLPILSLCIPLSLTPSLSPSFFPSTFASYSLIPWALSILYTIHHHIVYSYICTHSAGLLGLARQDFTPQHLYWASENSTGVSWCCWICTLACFSMFISDYSWSFGPWYPHVKKMSSLWLVIIIYLDLLGLQLSAKSGEEAKKTWPL